MKKIVLLPLLLSLVLLPIAGCDNQKQARAKQKKERIVMVEKKPDIIKLFYSGVIKPIRIDTVTSPVEGVVTNVNFKYGQIVKKDQHLLALSSQKLEEQFHEAVKSFLKAKDTYMNSKINFEGARELFKEKIISRQEFTNEKSQYQNNELAFVDAKFKLEQVLENVPGVDKELENLSLQDVSKIRDIFERQLESISIKARETGIVLFPVAKADKQESGNVVMEVGAELKKGQAIVSIGDLTGVGVEFNAGEGDINRIKPQQKVLLSIMALDESKFDGIVKSVGVQAKQEGRSGEGAQFPVRVEVPKISAKQRMHLRVGMTAKIEVDLVGEPILLVPLRAIELENGERVVTVVNKDGQRAQRVVTTGRTTLTDVTILKGLAPGEKVVVHD